MNKKQRQSFRELIHSSRLDLQGVQEELTSNGTRGASSVSQAIHDAIRNEGASSFRAEAAAEGVQVSLRNALEQVERARINLESLARALNQAELAVENSRKK